MRIVIFTDTYEPEINGVTTSITNFTELLAQKGHQFLIICPKYKDHKDLPKDNIKIKRYPAFSFITNKATRLAFTPFRNIISEIKKFNPDVVHIQTPMNLGAAGIIVSKMLDLKIIETYHTYIPDFLIYLHPKNLLGLNKLEQAIKESKLYESFIENVGRARVLRRFSKDVARIRKGINFVKAKEKRSEKINFQEKFGWDFTRIIYNRADLVLTPSFALKRELEKNGVYVPVDVQSNGIEVKEFTVKEDYTLKNKILHIGRLGPEKNVDVLLKAFALIAKKNKELTFEIIGDGPERKYLEKLAKRLRIDSQVVFRGFLDRSIVIKEISESDLFVTASTIETQGLVILEAMASGLPVIGVDALAIPEAVIDSVNGFVVRPGDHRAIAEKFKVLLENQELREAMGKESVKLAGNHNLELAAEKLENQYTKMAKKEIPNLTPVS